MIEKNLTVTYCYLPIKNRYIFVVPIFCVTVANRQIGRSFIHTITKTIINKKCLLPIGIHNI